MIAALWAKILTKNLLNKKQKCRLLHRSIHYGALRARWCLVNVSSPRVKNIIDYWRQQYDAHVKYTIKFQKPSIDYIWSPNKDM